MLLFQLYFRELPVPLLTYSLYSSFVRAIRSDISVRHQMFRQTLQRLSQHHTRTLSHVLQHLHHVSQFSHVTGMTCRNLALVWAPNLLRCQGDVTMVSAESLRDIGVQVK